MKDRLFPIVSNAEPEGPARMCHLSPSDENAPNHLKMQLILPDRKGDTL